MKENVKGCAIIAFLFALVVFTIVAEIGKALTWIKWGFQ